MEYHGISWNIIVMEYLLDRPEDLLKGNQPMISTWQLNMLEQIIAKLVKSSAGCCHLATLPRTSRVFRSIWRLPKMGADPQVTIGFKTNVVNDLDDLGIPPF